MARLLSLISAPSPVSKRTTARTAVRFTNGRAPPACGKLRGVTAARSPSRTSPASALALEGVDPKVEAEIARHSF